ncbi:NUDIX hydrolase [candidate division KSB1 bacterium]|nr:NUDIX hydrolase [candidate division KSB1 bacterium]NIR73149.1 NUDIX hydrolase [candidate division KSB1 bacterium]NIS23852.1 NUDIX hydrolase [candidate division KSB1 bacterium]NIT70773.1 NUDIX hydrolase [candidate division KSB1 bacterium]NIU24501.1 NUDIX hydrolase [candidate division KSB1 bacterium]
MNYCNNCGSKIKFGEVPGESLPRYFCDQCHTIHYENPNMIVGCLPRWGDRVLLCKRAIEPRKDKWTLPAGFLENGENVEDGALRETLEEANADVDIVRLFSVYSLPHVGQVYLMFLADLRNLNFSTGLESSDVRLFTKNQIPWDQIAFTAIKFTLEKFFDSTSQTNGEAILGGYTKY